MNVLPMLMIVLLSLNVLMRLTATPVFVWTVSLTLLLLMDFYPVESAAMQATNVWIDQLTLVMIMLIVWTLLMNTPVNVSTDMLMFLQVPIFLQDVFVLFKPLVPSKRPI